MLLDEQSGVFWPEKNEKGKENRNKSCSFPLTCDGYRYFKMEINELIDNRQKVQLGELALIYEDSYSDYQRSLDIDHSLHMVSYREGGVTYKREYFMSYPDNVMVVRLTSNGKNALSRTISLKSLHKTKSITAEGNTLTLTGYPTPVSGDKRVGDAWQKGLRYAQQIEVRHTGGSLSVVDGDKIRVSGAHEILILMTAATNYVQCMDDTYNFFSREDPLDKVHSKQ